MTDNRSEARAITDVALEVYDMSSHGLLAVARLTSLSVSGASVETTTELAGRTHLFIRMLLNNRLVAVPVSIVWDRPGNAIFEYGLRFGPYSEEMQAIVRAYMKEYLAFYEETDLSLSPPPPPAKPPKA